MPIDVLGIDLGDDEGHAGVLPPDARVVDGDGAGVAGGRAVLLRSGAGGRHEYEVRSLE